MAARLTDKQKKSIIADYAEIGSYNAVAKKHGVSDNTVRRVVMADPDFSEKVEQKKKENSADILAYMDTKKDVVCAIIEDYLDALRDPEKIEKATTVQLSTTLGTLIDKWTNTKQINGDLQTEDDPITKALKEEFKNELL